jgi:hypothetical protein
VGDAIPQVSKRIVDCMEGERFGGMFHEDPDGLIAFHHRP